MNHVIEYNGFRYDMAALQPDDAEKVLKQCLTAIRNSDKEKVYTLIIEWNTNNLNFIQAKEMTSSVLVAYDNSLKENNKSEKGE